MKNTFWAIPAILLTFAAAQTQPQTQPAPPAQQQAQPAQPQAQAAPQAHPQVYGRGRGGQPWAWNDRDKDGNCDLTGRPVGQRPLGYGRGAAARGGGWGRGPGGRGFAARGGGRGRWWGPGSAARSAPVQPPASAVPAQSRQ